MKPFLVLGFLLGTFAFSQTPDPTPSDGKISGTVMDAADKPLAGATVSFVEQSLLSITNAYPIQIHADTHGHFDSGQMLKHAVYDVYAWSEKDGYPDRSSSFYRLPDFEPQTVQLFGAQPEAKVEIKLAERACVLTGNVTDSNTGEPLDASVLLLNMANERVPGTPSSKRVQVKNGKFRELVPENTDIDVIVEKPVVEAWSHFSQIVHLQPGEVKNLDIRLYKTE